MWHEGQKTGDCDDKTLVGVFHSLNIWGCGMAVNSVMFPNMLAHLIRYLAIQLKAEAALPLYGSFLLSYRIFFMVILSVLCENCGHISFHTAVKYFHIVLTL